MMSHNANEIDPPFIQIPRTGSRDGRKCGKLATRTIVAVVKRTSLVPLALRRRASNTPSHHAHHQLLQYTKRMTVIRMLLFFGLVMIWMFAEVSAVPTRYDQRQEGNSNLHAKLENFLFVIAIPSNNEFFSDLALQALELKQHLNSRSSSPKEQESIISGVERFDLSSELVSTSEENESSVRKAGEENISLSNKQVEKSESAERIPKNTKGFEFPKSRQVPSILGYLMDARNRSKTENSGRFRNVLGNVWNSELTTLGTVEMPGTLLKEQLLQKEEDDVALPSTDADKNDVTSFSEKKRQELTLLGDGIENCGPGRHRDASGICQSDESADSPL